MNLARFAIEGSGISSERQGESLIGDSAVLGRDFYERPTVEVARDLLGKILVHGSTAGRIVEVEAYLGQDDRAAHTWHGLTERTRVIFGPPGRAYVYLVYGLHECLNLVAERDGSPGCVLVRALEPLAGIGVMRRRRGVARLEELASGPGKLTEAMGITRRLNGVCVTSGALTVRRLRGEPAASVVTATRVGIRHERERPLRFLLEGSRFVSTGP
jgi:DNA-3-methyladenine glycosylase